MLTYHAAFDVYHCMFRCSLLLDAHPKRAMTVDVLRILDLIFLFPHILSDFDFPRGAKNKGISFAKASSKYNNLPSPELFIQQARILNMTSLSALAGRRFIEEKDLRNGFAKRTEKAFPDELLASANQYDTDLAIFLSQKLGTLPLLGPKGLKARSHLMEYRYDAA